MAPGVNHLSALPVELFIDVAKHLPAREICRLRAQNRYCRDAIDANQVSLTKETIEHNRERLELEQSMLSTPFSAMIEGLVLFGHYYGDFSCTHIMNTTVCSTLIVNWSAYPQQSPHTPNFQVWLLPRLKTIVDQYFDVQFRRHSRNSHRQDHDISYGGLVSALSGTTIVTLDEEKVKEAMEDTDMSYRAPSLGSDGLPAHFLTTRANLEGAKPQLNGRCDAVWPRIQSQLTLPDLTDMNGFLAWATDNDGTEDLVKELSVGDATFIHLKQAAVLEDLYVY